MLAYILRLEGPGGEGERWKTGRDVAGLERDCCRFGESTRKTCGGVK